MKKDIIPYSKPSIDNSDIKSVVSVLKSGMLTQGKNVPKFEKLVSKFVNAKYAIAVNSATSALHLSCLSLNLKKNDIVWTSNNTFVSTANSALLCGAKVDLLEIDLNTNNICLEKLKKKLASTKKNKLPKILILVHIAGMPCDLKEVYKLSRIYKFNIIEDASHALGSKYFKEPIGNCKFSKITIFSFHPVKNITTGEGGMAVTNSKILFNKIKALRTHGILYNNNSIKKKVGKLPGFYQQKYLGLNYRMSDISAILGISQLKKLRLFIKKRNKIAKYYSKNLKNLPLIIPKFHKEYLSAFHLYIIKVNCKNAKKIRDEIFYKFLKNNFKINIHYIPVHSHPYFQKLGFYNKIFKISELYYNTAISIPIFPNLSLLNQKKIIKIIKSSFVTKN